MIDTGTFRVEWYGADSFCGVKAIEVESVELNFEGFKIDLDLTNDQRIQIAAKMIEATNDKIKMSV